MHAGQQQGKRSTDVLFTVREKENKKGGMRRNQQVTPASYSRGLDEKGFTDDFRVREEAEATEEITNSRVKRVCVCLRMYVCGWHWAGPLVCCNGQSACGLRSLWQWPS